MHIRHLACIALAVAALLCPSGQVWPAEDANAARRAEVGRQLALADPRVRDLDEGRRDRLVAFVIGNIVFTLAHELGHAVISELKLPVLGREEDAADTFASLVMLNLGTDLSHKVLLNTVQGLFLLAERGKKSGRETAMYDEHGLDPQRAFQIVCFMVGSNRRAFGSAANIAKMPTERQESCRDDFDRATKSWTSVLKDHLRTDSDSRTSFLDRLLQRTPPPAQPRPRASAKYQDAKGPMEPYRSTLMAAGVLDLVSSFADDSFAFPRKIGIVGKTCGEPNAFWDERGRELTLCYELVAEYAKLGLEVPEP